MNCNTTHYRANSSSVPGDPTELPALVARLRAADFPPDIVRAIVAGQVENQFAARRKALDPEADLRPFWKDAPPSLGPLLAQLSREQRDLLRQLLGQDAEPGNPVTQARERLLYGHLPPEKAGEVRALVRQFEERRAALNDFGSPDPAKLQALEKDQRAALAALLTPDELFEHDLRTHRSATNLRNNLSAFRPTEAEFRTIFQIQRVFDDQYPANSFVDMVANQSRGEAQRQLALDIKAALGPERGADYERTNDSNYRRTSQLVARLELPPETTDQLASLQKEYTQKRLDASRAIPGATAADRNAQLAALHQEATARVAALLRNERHVEAYKQYGGNWLQNLAPRPPPSATK